ncbi:DUF3429 domain-containing protein [Congregibacter litoralis]|uniref:DUF3429 domain-containing protein n=1 Tax=Congregibacter litoralis KT71 TaxID=314285 RepID=A4A7Y7_9GAMM|nr:DUF3429 domain-containing protein [Congregibacter litoralis]EAQ97782.1 hypothetical protein KT71_14469 [Congregibacter litoralis KT71]
MSMRLMQALGVAGLIPFIVASLGVMFLDDLLLALSQRSFLLYSTAILCFLGGTLWGETLPEPAAGQGAAILISNGIVLFAVLAMLTAQPLLAALLLMLGHLALLWYERQLPHRADWYTRMRSWLTFIAVLTHLMFSIGLTMRATP